MSGTSLDGIDIAHISLVYKDTWTFQMHQTTTIPYPDTWKRDLAQAVKLSKAEVEKLDQNYTQFLAEQINYFVQQHQITELLAICSHGHTVFHRPDLGYTLQIGNREELAKLTGYRVVCDFRTADVELGGQGAPLVPIGDQLLFADYDYCLNLGGFANVSHEHEGNRIAYDICPVNVVMNKLASRLGTEYDKGGAFAKAGTPHSPSIEQLNNLPYYQLPAPKSLGMEWVNEFVFPILETIDRPQDALATFIEHIADQIYEVLPVSSTVLVTGGGAYNRFLLERLQTKGLNQLVIPQSELVEFKEALIFGLLGVLRLRHANNCLSSVTGAQKDHSSGRVLVP